MDPALATGVCQVLVHWHGAARTKHYAIFPLLCEIARCLGATFEASWPGLGQRVLAGTSNILFTSISPTYEDGLVFTWAELHGRPRPHISEAITGFWLFAQSLAIPLN